MFFHTPTPIRRHRRFDTELCVRLYAETAKPSSDFLVGHALKVWKSSCKPENVTSLHIFGFLSVTRGFNISRKEQVGFGKTTGGFRIEQGIVALIGLLNYQVVIKPKMLIRYRRTLFFNVCCPLSYKMGHYSGLSIGGSGSFV